MKRAILIVSLLVASQPLLIGAGVLAKWTVECGGGACAGTVHAASPFGTPRDVILTALAAAAPYLLVVLVAAGTWLLAGRGAAQSAGSPFPARPAHRLASASRPEGFAHDEDAGGRLPALP